MGKLEVLDPAAEPTLTFTAPAPRLSQPAGKRLWFLDSQGIRQGGQQLLNPMFARWRERLSQEFPLEGTRWACSENIAVPFRHGKALFDQVAREAGAVFNGVACDGAGTSVIVHDSVQLERLGVPTVTLVTDNALPFARAQARILGMPELQMVVLSSRIYMYTLISTVEEAVRAADELYPAALTALRGV